ncbi:hypothetical protein TNCT6_67890 [Streptomyces sp. 6-11-2]|nr:hypothetical protein TNCT6_67890 [Streptomyces sp. 6-11-2]
MVDDKEEGRVHFSVAELEGGTLVGTAALWGIDNHNRSAHIGLGLLPSSRSKGYGTDVAAVLCHYGFVVRGLQRLQIEALSDNTAMLRSAERNGFVREGVLRSSAWVMGEFLDEVLIGLLVQDWKPEPKGQTAARRSRAGRGADAYGRGPGRRRCEERANAFLASLLTGERPRQPDGSRPAAAAPVPCRARRCS